MTPKFIDNSLTENISNNSANETSMNNDVVLDNFNIGLETHDKMVLHHIIKNIKPKVIQNNQQIDVPVNIGNRELWETIQYEGYYRDKNGKILVPLIALNRNNIEKNRQYMSKIDSTFPQKAFVAETSYSSRNRYDRFSILNNVIPQKQLYVVQVPDYITITYDVSMITNYMFQMNSLVESFMYAENSYWGDDTYKFKVMIENISNSSEFTVGEERYIRNEFSIKLNGYIIPNVIQKELNKEGMYYSKSKFVMLSEVVDKF